MKSRTRTLTQLCIALTLIGTSLAQAQDAPSAATSGIDIGRLIAGTAQQTGKKFLVDPRIRAQVTLIGFDPDRLDYPTLLSVLQMHGFTAVDDGDFVRVVPDVNARQMAMPVPTGNAAHADAEYVTRIIAVKNVPAPMLVPLLRPLLPQQSHLVSLPCTNTLVLVDSFANVRRLERIVSELDTGEPYRPEKCGAPTVAKQD